MLAKWYVGGITGEPSVNEWLTWKDGLSPFARSAFPPSKPKLVNDTSTQLVVQGKLDSSTACFAMQRFKGSWGGKGEGSLPVEQRLQVRGHG